jgi:hypothetical protein
MRKQYWTFNDANHKPAPMEAAKATAINNGQVKIRQVGTKLYQ